MAYAVGVNILNALSKPVRAGVNPLPFEWVALQNERIPSLIEASVGAEIETRYLPEPFLEAIKVVTAAHADLLHDLLCRSLYWVFGKQMNRKRTPAEIETAVLLNSAQRCTLCFHLSCDLDEKLGQIAHLDNAPSNSEEDNLAFMCLFHHSLFDSTTSQHKNYTIHEVKAARSRLYRAISENRHAVPPPIAAPGSQSDADQLFFGQRTQLAETDVIQKIWATAHWQIWIRPTEFVDACFRDLAHCRHFMRANIVRSLRVADFPAADQSAIAEHQGGHWIAAELDQSASRPSLNMERWVLFRSGQFICNRALVEQDQLGNNVHYLEVLRLLTQVFQFTARMARDRVLAPAGRVDVNLKNVAGRGLWVPDLSASYWSRGQQISISRHVSAVDLAAQEGRDLALDVIIEMYRRFGWEQPPVEELALQQGQF
jgi:hypothetical protein